MVSGVPGPEKLCQKKNWHSSKDLLHARVEAHVVDVVRGPEAGREHGHLPAGQCRSPGWLSLHIRKGGGAIPYPQTARPSVQITSKLRHVRKSMSRDSRRSLQKFFKT